VAPIRRRRTPHGTGPHIHRLTANAKEAASVADEVRFLVGQLRNRQFATVVCVVTVEQTVQSIAAAASSSASTITIEDPTVLALSKARWSASAKRTAPRCCPCLSFATANRPIKVALTSG
jgi:hypothetical protein